MFALTVRIVLGGQVEKVERSVDRSVIKAAIGAAVIKCMQICLPETMKT